MIAKVSVVAALPRARRELDFLLRLDDAGEDINTAGN
jgi:hypothetical protein